MSWCAPLKNVKPVAKTYTLVYGERRSDPEKRLRQMRAAQARYRAKKKQLKQALLRNKRR